MDNTETQATLGTKHRTKTTKAKTQHRKIKRHYTDPIRKPGVTEMAVLTDVLIATRIKREMMDR